MKTKIFPLGDDGACWMWFVVRRKGAVAVFKLRTRLVHLGDGKIAPPEPIPFDLSLHFPFPFESESGVKYDDCCWVKGGNCTMFASGLQADTAYEVLMRCGSKGLRDYLRKQLKSHQGKK